MDNIVTGNQIIDGVLERVRKASMSKQKASMGSLVTKTEKEQKNSYSCDKCKDTTWILDNTGRVIERCKCYELIRVKEQWEASGLKTGDLDKTFKSYEPWNSTTKHMKNVVTSYYLRFKEIEKTDQNSILLCGQPGVGKTHLCMALANNFIKNDGKKVVYMPYRDAITKLKQSVSENKEYYQELINKYKKAEILLIDDLFKGNITKLTMIVSTEYSVAEILNFDEGTSSRIYNMSKDFTVEIKGQENNYRLKG